MLALITGASGFLGQFVVDAMLVRGHHVRALLRNASAAPRRAWSNRVEVLRGDLRGRELPRGMFDGVDVLIHLAACLGGDEDRQFNSTVVGTENLLAAMQSSATRRIVLASSFSVYGWTAVRGTMDETSPLESRVYERGGYAIAKLWQERVARRICEEQGWDLAILRPGFIWGPGHADVPAVHFTLGPVELVWGIGRRLPLTYVENCADCFVTAAEQQPGGIHAFNVIDSDAVTGWRYAGEYLTRSATRAIRIPVPFAALSFAAWTADRARTLVFGTKGRLPSALMPARLALHRPRRYSTRKLAEELRWSPPFSFEQSLDRCFAASLPDSGDLQPTGRRIGR